MLVVIELDVVIDWHAVTMLHIVNMRRGLVICRRSEQNEEGVDDVMVVVKLDADAPAAKQIPAFPPRGLHVGNPLFL